MRAHALRHCTVPPFDGTHSPRVTSGVTAQDLRATNLSMVLRFVLTSPGSITRAAIAAATGTTRATVSRLVDDLVSRGVITESAPTSTQQRGRPAISLSPTQGTVAALGLEVTVDTLKAHLLDLSGHPLALSQAPRPKDSSPQATLEALRDMAASLMTTPALAHTHYIGAALALPGIVTHDRLVRAHNLGWDNIAIQEICTHLGDFAPRFIANEADLAAYRVAHPRPGVPSEFTSFIYVSGEVGVGSGIILNHRQFTGSNGGGGEIGHISVDPHGTKCSCGSQGCVETFLGRKALAIRAGLAADASPRDVIAAALQGNTEAQRALDDGAHALGTALAAMMNILDIPLVILGGNLADLADALVGGATEQMRRLCPQARLVPTRITTIQGSTDFSVEGAASRLLEDFVSSPATYIDAFPGAR